MGGDGGNLSKKARFWLRTLPVPGAEPAALVSPDLFGGSQPEPLKEAPCPEQQGPGRTRRLGPSPGRSGRLGGVLPCTPIGDCGLPFTAGSQVPRRNFALHMRRSWLVHFRSWGRRPPSSALGMAWGSAGKRRATISPIHTGKREMPGLHFQSQTRQPLLGPKASRELPRPPALPERRSGRVVRARHCNPTLHPRPGSQPLGPRARLQPPATPPPARELACRNSLEPADVSLRVTRAIASLVLSPAVV